MAGPAGVPGFYDPKRAQRPGLGKASLDAGQVVPLTVSLPPGSSLATTNSELNGNYSEAQSKLAAAQASGDPAAIDKAQTNVYLRETQLNTFVKGQNDTTRSTLDEKNYNAPGANTIAATTATTAEGNRDDVPASAASSTQTAQTNSIRLVPFDNVLHEYSSYTYKISLSVLSQEDYNSLHEDPTRNVDDFKNLLIASGGASQDKRAAYFKEDFYFDSMEIKSMFGSTQRNSNATGFNFKIIEPYGVTLLERLVKAVTEMTQSNNYVAQPYLLTLDFWGYDDQAESPKKIEGCTRHFIIGITNITFGVTAKGAEYEVTAMPYAHTAFNDTAASISANFEVSAKTVAEFFGDSSEAIAGLNNVQKTVAEPPPREAQGLMAGMMRDASADRLKRNTVQAFNTGEIKNSLSFVLNQNERKKQGDQQEIADEYSFEIDKSIADALILSADDKDIKGTPMKTELYKKYAASASNKSISYDNDKRKIAVAGGTTLLNLINDIVLHSTYTLDQIISAEDKEAADTLKAEKPIQWLIVIPDVKILGFDKKRNTYAKRFIYKITEFSVFGHNHEQMGQAPVPGVSKIYDYFYTGQNKDIIDLKIEYNGLYMQFINANRGIKAGATPTAGIDKNPDKTDTTNPAGSAFPSQVAVTNSPALTSPARASTNSNDLIIDDVNNSLLSKGSTTDMTTITISIVGDPAYITQADTFYGKFTTKDPILPDRSLNPCVTDIYALIRFNTPNDIDLENGIYDFTDKGEKEVTSSAFTGLYKITQLESNFSGGKFTQTLNLMRAPEQSTDFVIESAAKAKFTKQDVSPEKIKKLTDTTSNFLNGLGGLGGDFPDIASVLAPVKNLLNGRNLV